MNNITFMPVCAGLLVSYFRSRPLIPMCFSMFILFWTVFQFTNSLLGSLKSPFKLIHWILNFSCILLNSGTFVCFIFIVAGSLLTFSTLYFIFLIILYIIILKFVFNNFITLYFFGLFLLFNFVFTSLETVLCFYRSGHLDREMDLLYEKSCR